MDRRVDVRHFVHRRSCDISSSNMAAYERWPRVSGRGTKYSTEVCRMCVQRGNGSATWCRKKGRHYDGGVWMMVVMMMMMMMMMGMTIPLKMMIMLVAMMMQITATRIPFRNITQITTRPNEFIWQCP